MPHPVETSSAAKTSASKSTTEKSTVVFDGSALCVQQIAQLAARSANVRLSDAPEFIARIDRGAEFLQKLWRENGEIYGVTTGYGDSCETAVPADLIAELPRHLFTFHGCGLGAHFSAEETRAILAARLASLARGKSGVRYELLRALTALIEADILPLIPQEGSVGASGDLTPLSYVAAVLSGERDVLHDQEIKSVQAAFTACGLAPITLQPKETLALMNGTAVMTGLACLALQRAQYLSKLSARITSIAVLALRGNSAHFDPLLFSVKPHPGQNQIAAWIHDDLQAITAPREGLRLQDRYSLRCAPHVIGVLQDSLPWLTQFIETELNSANDNPIIDGDGEHVLHGGHFYGGHIAFAMDALKNAVANIADLLDRQLAQLVDVKMNHGLPPNLSGAEGARRSINHGFKAVQIGTSAWTAEALKLTMPASVFSRSTECHNQDKVSMGTIAARDCLRVLQLTEQVAAATLLGACQGLQLRMRQNEIDAESLSAPIRDQLAQVVAIAPFVEEDRALESALRELVAATQQQRWTLYDAL